MLKKNSILYRFSISITTCVIILMRLSEETSAASFIERRNLKNLFGLRDKLMVEDMTRSERSNWREVVGGNESSCCEIMNDMNIWSKSGKEESLKLYEELKSYSSLKDDEFSCKLKMALRCLEGAYRLYGCKSIIGSFNGGKDAVVILHLLRAVQAKYGGENRPRVIYFENELEFKEVRDFVKDSVEICDLDMMAFDSSFSFVDGLKAMVDCNDSQMAFVLGTRCDDPNAGSQGTFAPSSDWMPPFMRVNPIIDWTYGDVWHFLREFNLPYCSLYDVGYTSLGNIHDTIPNPSLLKPNGGYSPAYLLQDWSKERAGRLSSQKKAKSEAKTLSAVSSESSFYDLQNHFHSDTTIQTVGLLVIGNEIMKGLIPDSNIYNAAVALRANPELILSRVVIVPDNFTQIVSEIKTLQNTVDVIITSGGIGPTHDDITIQSISSALSLPLVTNPEMVSILESKFEQHQPKNDQQRKSLKETLVKLATLPQNCRLQYFRKQQEWPILQCQNIFILPGVPQLFLEKIYSIVNYLTNSTTTIQQQQQQQSDAKINFSFKVLLRIHEFLFVHALNQVVQKHPNVTFGSYPNLDSSKEYKTVVTLEGKKHPNGNDSEEVQMHLKLALAEFLKQVPDGSVVKVENNDNLADSNM